MCTTRTHDVMHKHTDAHTRNTPHPARAHQPDSRMNGRAPCASISETVAFALVLALTILVQPATPAGALAALRGGSAAPVRVAEVLRHDAAKDNDELFALSLKVKAACALPHPWGARSRCSSVQSAARATVMGGPSRCALPRLHVSPRAHRQTRRRTSPRIPSLRRTCSSSRKASTCVRARPRSGRRRCCTGGACVCRPHTVRARA